MTTEPTAPRTLTVVVVDDHEVVRQGLVAMLDRRPGFQVVGEAGTVAEALEVTTRFQPDLVVMDVRLPDGSGIEACREIRASLPGTRVMMLTSYPDEEAVLAAIVAGASGYLLKQVRARDLVAALEAVGRGESLLDPAVTGKVLERMRRIATSDQPDELAALTQQERKILALVADGMTNKEIAAEIFLSDKTVKNYVSSILAKLNLERRAQAAAFVARLKTHPGRLIRQVATGTAWSVRAMLWAQAGDLVPRPEVAVGRPDAGHDELLAEAEFALVESSREHPVLDRERRGLDGGDVDRVAGGLRRHPERTAREEPDRRLGSSSANRSTNAVAGSSQRPM